MIARLSVKPTHRMWNAHPQWIQLICFECTPFGFRHLGAAQLSSTSAAAWSFGKSFSVSWVCCSCVRDSSFSSFKALFSMSGAMMSSFSSSLAYSSNWSVSLCSPEIRFLRIQLPEGSLIRSCESSGWDERLFVSKMSTSSSSINSYWCFDVKSIGFILFFSKHIWFSGKI